LSIKLNTKSNECQEWKQKYEESDSQLESMEKTLEDMQKESYSKTKQFSSRKEKELSDLERTLRGQFEEQMQQYQENISKMQHELSNSKGQSREVANEILRLTNENSDLNMQINRVHSDQATLKSTNEQLSRQNMELKEEIRSHNQDHEEMYSKEEYESVQSNEQQLKSIVKQIERQMQVERKEKQQLEHLIGSTSVEELKQEIEQLQDKLSEKDQDLRSFINENEKLKKQYISTESKLSKNTRKLDMATDKAREKSVELSEIKEKFKQKAAKMQSYIESCEQYRQVLDKLEVDIENLNRRNIEVTNERDDIRNRYKKLVGLDNDVNL